jgi:alanine racemase
VAFASMAEFYAAFDHLHFEQETILIKGARDFRFEEIVTLLEQKTHETVLEINLNAISHNYNFYKSKLAPNTRMMVMVKAFGYGNGGVEIARLLEYHKVDYLGVAFADEGIALKEAGIQVPIMVMNPESTAFSAIIAHGLEPEIYSLKGFKTFLALAHERKLKAYPIHLKLDTGMHRLGFSNADLTELITLLQGQTYLEVRSILSHLAASDDLFHKAFTHQQIIAFTEMADQLDAQLPNTPLRHILNTSGISNFPDAQLDMVRLGIGLYGISNDRDEQKQLERVGTLKSVISQLHHIPAGDSVGYGRRYLADENRSIATIPIGYADGIRRSWGNGLGYIMIHGQKAPIVGSVCMDMLMADVTGIDCKEGNTVILLGEQPSVQDMADALGTIPYEILTGISQRVKRVFYRE